MGSGGEVVCFLRDVEQSEGRGVGGGSKALGGSEVCGGTPESIPDVPDGAWRFYTLNGTQCGLHGPAGCSLQLSPAPICWRLLAWRGPLVGQFWVAELGGGSAHLSEVSGPCESSLLSLGHRCPPPTPSSPTRDLQIWDNRGWQVSLLEFSLSLELCQDWNEQAKGEDGHRHSWLLIPGAPALPGAPESRERTPVHHCGLRGEGTCGGFASCLFP